MREKQSREAPQSEPKHDTPAFIEWPDFKSPEFQNLSIRPPRFWKQVEELQSQLERAKGIRECLNSLEKAAAIRGVPCPHPWRQGLHTREARRQFRSEVLSLLSLEVYSQVKKFDWLKEMRRGNRRLRSLALHLRSITSEIERTYNNPGSDAELLGWILQLSTEFPVIPASKRPPVRLLKDMRAGG